MSKIKDNVVLAEDLFPKAVPTNKKKHDMDHFIQLVGYNKKNKDGDNYYIVRNSWGHL